MILGVAVVKLTPKEINYKFSLFQNEEVQLIYIDKIVIAKSECSKLENMLLVMKSIFTHVRGMRVFVLTL